MFMPMPGSNQNETPESSDEIEQIRLLLFGEVERAQTERIRALEHRVSQLESLMAAMVEHSEESARTLNAAVKSQLSRTGPEPKYGDTEFSEESLSQVSKSNVREP